MPVSTYIYPTRYMSALPVPSNNRRVVLGTAPWVSTHLRFTGRETTGDECVDIQRVGLRQTTSLPLL